MKLDENRLGGERLGLMNTLCIVKYWDDRESDIFVRREIANEFVKLLLENDLIDFKVSEKYDEANMCRRIVASLNVAKPLGGEEE